MAFGRKKERNPFTGQKVDDTPVDTTERLRKSGYSSYYHKYFEGWYERPVTDKNGRQKIERIYAGDTYRHSLETSRWVLLKLCYLMLFLIAVGNYVSAAAQTITSVYAWYMVVAVAIGAFSLFLLLYTIVGYLMGQRNLTVWGYKETHEVLLRRCLTAVVGTLLPILPELVYSILNAGNGEWAGELQFMLRCICTAGVIAIIWYTEAKRVVYEVIPFEGELPSDAIML